MYKKTLNCQSKYLPKGWVLKNDFFFTESFTYRTFQGLLKCHLPSALLFGVGDAAAAFPLGAVAAALAVGGVA